MSVSRPKPCLSEQKCYISAIYHPDLTVSFCFNFYLVAVQAGFPSPADDRLESSLSLDQYLVKHPAATFFVRVAGDSMIGAGIHPNDILVVDRALDPKHGNVVIAVINGELTVKRLHQEDSHTNSGLRCAKLRQNTYGCI